MANVDVCAELKTRLPDLPRIMRAKNWPVGADLMSEWLNRGYNESAASVAPNSTRVRLEWVLSYPRAMRVYRDGKESAVWTNDAARVEIIKKLNGKWGLPKEVGEKLEVGSVGDGVSHSGMIKFHKEFQVQYMKVTQTPYAYEFIGTGIENTLDDLYAALGDFHFYYLIKGFVERLSDYNEKRRYKVTIQKVGVYAEDVYDFVDRSFRSKAVSQILGFWGCKDNYVGRFPGNGRYLVRNNDFIEWRKKYGNGRGGDFMVFSNIIVFDHHSTFEFSND